MYGNDIRIEHVTSMYKKMHKTVFGLFLLNNSPFMIKCPVCHFPNYSLEGANTKLSVFPHSK